MIGERPIVGWVLDNLEAHLGTRCGAISCPHLKQSHLRLVLHQLVRIVEFVECIRRETERFREQTDEAIAELLYVSKVSFHGISVSWYKLFVGPLETGPIVDSGCWPGAGNHTPGKVPTLASIPERRVSTESGEGLRHQTIPYNLSCLS